MLPQGTRLGPYVFQYGPAQVTADGRQVVVSAHRLLSRLITVEGVLT